MRRNTLMVLLLGLMALGGLLGGCGASGPPPDARVMSVADVRDSYAKNINRQVYIQEISILTVTSNPPGTNKGTYEITDDSNQHIFVGTKQLPAIGTYNLLALITLDPQTNKGMLMEVALTPFTASGNWWTDPRKLMILGGAVLLLGLIVGLIMMLMKPDAEPQPAAGSLLSRSGVASGLLVGSRAPGEDKTITVPKGGSQEAPGGATLQVPLVRGELQAISGTDTGSTFPVVRPVNLIGREGGRRNDIVVRDKSCSREQGRIIVDSTNKTFQFVNEGATNKARINGQEVVSVFLESGDEIEFGLVKLKFRILA